MIVLMNRKICHLSDLTILDVFQDTMMLRNCHGNSINAVTWSDVQPGLYRVDGDGMLHACRIMDGKATYSSHQIRTAKLQAELEEGDAFYLKVCLLIYAA